MVLFVMVLNVLSMKLVSCGEKMVFLLVMVCMVLFILVFDEFFVM